MSHNRYEWQLSFNTDGVDAKCVQNPDSPDELIIERIPISDDPKMSWPAAQEEAKSILRLKCTRDIQNTTWDDLQAAMYAISNQKWLENKILDAAKRRWPDNKIAEQWLILGALAVNNSTYKKWVDKLIPLQQEPQLHQAWITWPGELQNQIAYSLNYLIQITNCEAIKCYSLPDLSELHTFNGNRIAMCSWKRASGDEEIWEVWADFNTLLIRQTSKNGWISSRAPLKKNLTPNEAIEYLMEHWQLNAKNPKLEDKLKNLIDIAIKLGLDPQSIITILWSSESRILDLILKNIYPNKSAAWYENIALAKTSIEANAAIKELNAQFNEQENIQ